MLRKIATAAAGRTRSIRGTPTTEMLAMASVAGCPRCSHELVIPDDIDPLAWAKCTACNALFQVQETDARRVNELVLVKDTPVSTESSGAGQSMKTEPLGTRSLGTRTVPIASSPTMGGIDPLVGGHGFAFDDASAEDALKTEPVVPRKRSAPTVDDLAPASRTWLDEATEEFAMPHEEPIPIESGEAKEPIDSAARTIDDESLAPNSGRPDAAVEIDGDELDDESYDSDFELEPADEQNDRIPTWDDSEQMERLLAGDNGVPADEPAPQPVAAQKPFISADLFMPSAVRRRRRRPSIVRMMTGVVLFGIVGLAIGYYILLAWRGTEGDVLRLAQFLPRAILPSEFSQSSLVAGGPRAADVDVVDQASFDAPMDDREVKPGEPSALAPPAAAPIREADPPHVAGAPSYSADELAVSLEAAKEAQAGLVTGRLSVGDAVRRTKGVSFSLLADLAQKVTLVDATSRPSDISPLVQETDTLFHETLSDAEIRGEIARIVPLWIGSKHRTHGGIFFAGTVASNAARGDVVECHVDLGSGEPLTILLAPDLADKLPTSGGPVSFVGSLVDRPADTVAGYHGDAAQAVWVGRVITLE